jgi:hypothetical protein
MRLTTPGAILLGFLAIAVAVFFALRTRPPPVSASDARASVATISAGSGAPTTVASDLPLPDAPKAPPPTGALADATRAIAAQHDALMKACWGSAMVGRAAYVVRVRFDDQGHQATKAQLSPRGQMRLDVAECVANHLGPIAIAQANAPASLEVPLTLP